MTQQEQTWNDVKEIWGNSSKGANINWYLPDWVKGKIIIENK